MGISVFDWNQLLAILPELSLVLLAVIVLAVDLALPAEKKRSLGLLTAAGLLIIFVVTLAAPGMAGPAFGGMVRNDGVGMAFRLLFLFSGILVALLSMDFRPLRQDGAYYGMLILAILGMSLMAVAQNLVMIYLAMEVTSLSAYVLVGFMRESPASTEAGVKYFLFGAFTSAVMIYGLSLLYGATSSLGYEEIAAALQGVPPAITLVGFLMVMVGFGFKVAMVPLHFWSPDVYQGAPTPITAFISVASKAAGFAALLRALHFMFPALTAQWIPLLIAVAMFTMTLGNLLAISQRNIKRMLAYSSIAQAGYILIGVTAGDALGLTAVLFYLFIYMLTNVGAFAIVVLVTNRTGSEEIADYAALSRRSPYLALALMVALLSLSGIPPAGGFVGKLFLFAAGINSEQVWLVVVAVLNVIVGLYYYLNVVKVMYTTRSEHEEEPIPVPAATKTVLAVTIAGVLLLGVLAGPFYKMALAFVAGWF